MDDEVISEITDGKDESKPYTEDQLIRRQVKSKERGEESMDEI